MPQLQAKGQSAKVGGRTHRASGQRGNRLGRGSEFTTLARLGERVALIRRFHEPGRAG